MMTFPNLPTVVRGVAELESTHNGIRLHRLPAWVRQQFPDSQLLAMESQPSGVRLVFRTDATAIDLVTHPTRVGYRGVTRARGCVDVYVNGLLASRDVLDGGDLITVDLETGQTSYQAGPSHTTTVRGLPSKDSHIVIWLPHNESIELIELRANAPVIHETPSAPRWTHHGSSISHGSNATAPSEIWPAVAARIAGVELNNLGFGGSAIVDPFMARVIRDADADVISVKLGINVVNLDAMRLRAFVPAIHGFLDTIRDGHPDTPLLLVSPIFCGIHESTPGPDAVDTSTLGTGRVQFIATGNPDTVAQGRLTLEVIRHELESLAERRVDPNLHYLDGTVLYGAQDAAELPLTDGLHPGPAAHQRIGERFAAAVLAEDAPFAQVLARSR